MPIFEVVVKLDLRYLAQKTRLNQLPLARDRHMRVDFTVDFTWGKTSIRSPAPQYFTPPPLVSIFETVRTFDLRYLTQKPRLDRSPLAHDNLVTDSLSDTPRQPQ